MGENYEAAVSHLSRDRSTEERTSEHGDVVPRFSVIENREFLQSPEREKRGLLGRECGGRCDPWVG